MSNEQLTTSREIIAYDLVDTQTGTVLKRYPYAKRVAARRAVDRKDLEYGAVRYTLRLILAEVTK